MLRSLKTKIFLLIFVIMIFTEFAITFSNHWYVNKVVLKRETVSAKNILDFVVKIINNGYETLIKNKYNTTINERKSQLKNQSEIVISVIKKNAALSDKEAQKRFLDWFRSAHFPDRSFWLLFDKTSKIVGHTDPDFDGLTIESLKDENDQRIVDFVKTGEFIIKGGYSKFRWNPPEKGSKIEYLGFFTPFPRWGWTLGTATRLDDLEEDIKEQEEKIMKGLEKTLYDIKNRQPRYFFIFNSKKEIIIPQSQNQGKYNYNEITNIQTNNLILDDLIQSVKTGNGVIRYKPHNSKELIQAHTQYIDPPLDWYVTVNVPFNEIQSPAKTLMARLSIIIGLIFLVSFIAAIIFVSRISHPLKMLSEYVKELPSKDLSSEAEEGSKSPIDDLPAKYKDEVGQLAESFIFMKAELGKLIKRQVEERAEKERIESELSVAREIQLGILPKKFPAFPDRKEFDLYAMMKPAEEVGGDLYDFFFIDKDHLCFTIGDVSEKGIPAALWMVITRTLIKMSAEKDVCSHSMMKWINKILSADNPNTMFVTLFIGILDIQTGEICYTNGGHNPPVILPVNQQAYYKTEKSGPMVGVEEDLDYRELNLKLNPGDALFLYTDGITEAKNPLEELFSIKRLIIELESIKNETNHKVITSIYDLVKKHSDTAPQYDDITMLMLRYNGINKGYDGLSRRQ